MLYLRDIAPQMRDNLLSLLSDLDFDNAVSLHVDAIDQQEAIQMAQRQLAFMLQEESEGMNKARRMNLPSYMGVRYELTNQVENTKELIDNLMQNNQKLFKVCVLVHTYGKTNADWTSVCAVSAARCSSRPAALRRSPLSSATR